MKDPTTGRTIERSRTPAVNTKAAARAMSKILVRELEAEYLPPLTNELAAAVSGLAEFRIAGNSLQITITCDLAEADTQALVAKLRETSAAAQSE